MASTPTKIEPLIIRAGGHGVVATTNAPAPPKTDEETSVPLTAPPAAAPTAPPTWPPFSSSGVFARLLDFCFSGSACSDRNLATDFDTAQKSREAVALYDSMLLK